jgi:xanthine dehydrogenase accessory factor
MISPALARRTQELAGERAPFAVATVVRVTRPSSVHAGDSALVLADGTIEGFVGGVCAADSVRLHALRAMETGEAVLLRLEPGDGTDAPEVEGAVTEVNPCLSGGALEIYVEPRLPAPRIVVVGDTPIAHELGELGRPAGFDVLAVAEGEPAISSEDAAVVVASHGRGEQPALTAALAAAVPYIGLVASRVRGRAVVESLGMEADVAARVHTPAGLDIGARTPAEIALSILAEIVASRREHAVPAAPATVAPAQAHEHGHHCAHHGH